MNYRSFADMNRAIVKNLHRFPHDMDLVVGVPRSGMMPANMLAVYMNKPFTSVEQLAGGVIYANGSRLIDRAEIKKILVVDDTVASGKEMNRCRELLSNVSVEKVYAAVYVTKKTRSIVDVYCETVNPPRLFEWNVFNTARVQQAMFDLDGVLCNDPAADDDGELYLNEITNAKPLYVPKYTIDTIVTCRLEKYRAVTERWLADNNVKYNRLVMLDLPSKKARLRWGKHGQWKGGIYAGSQDSLFYESSLSQAVAIRNESLKPVFCTETMEFVQ